MRKVPKTFTISKTAIELLNQAAKDEDRTASKIVDTLILNKIIRLGCCDYCNSEMTSDEIRLYKDICYKCCSKAWRAYELAHGGVCRSDIKKRHVTKAIKNDIMNRDGGKCLKCNSTENLTIDHITPLAVGGDNDYNNLQTLCSKCNSKKSTSIEDNREVI